MATISNPAITSLVPESADLQEEQVIEIVDEIKLNAEEAQESAIKETPTIIASSASPVTTASVDQTARKKAMMQVFGF